MTAALLVGVALVAYVVNDRRRDEALAIADDADRSVLAARITNQLRRLTERLAADVRSVTTRATPPQGSDGPSRPSLIHRPEHRSMLESVAT